MKRVLAVLVCCLCLTGCQLRRGQTEEAGQLLYEAAGIPEGTALLQVDGRDVPGWRYLYWLADSCDALTEQAASQGQEVDWEQDTGSGTAAEYVRRQAEQVTALYATVESWAETYGCKLEEADRQDMEAQWTALCARYGGEEACLQALAQRGLDREMADAFTADYYLYHHLYKLSATVGSALEPQPEEVQAYAREQELLTVEVLRITAQGLDRTSPQWQERRERGEMVLAKLKESADPVSYFSTLQGTYGDQTEELPAGPLTLPAADDRLPQACRQAAAQLEEGTWSGLLEDGDGLYILLRLPLEETAVTRAYFDWRLQAAAEEADVKLSRAAKTLDLERFLSRWKDLRTKNAAAERSSFKMQEPSGENELFHAVKLGKLNKGKPVLSKN